MDCSPRIYHYVDGFEPKKYFGPYFSASASEEVLNAFTIELIKKLKKTFSSGDIGGGTLIDISAGHILFQLFPIRNFFKEIIILEYNDQSISELRNWMNNDPEAYDWGYAAKIVMKLEDTSESSSDIQNMVRKKTKDIVKCDLAKKNPASPVQLPKARCILSVWLLEVVSEDLDAYRRNLKNMSSLLEDGGHLILFLDLNTSFFTIDGKKYNVLKYDEVFVRQALTDEGYLIKKFEEVPKAPTDLYDIKKMMFVVAQKQ